MTEKFAFETGRVSIAFILPLGLGDCVVARKIFNAVIELAPHCVTDAFCLSNAHQEFAKAFLGDIKNLNRILGNENLTKELAQKYDLVLRMEGTFALFPEVVKPDRIKSGSPALFECLSKIAEYNKRNVAPFTSSFIAYAMHNVVMSRILRKNYDYFLSCGGALPVRENGFKMPLSLKHKPQFDALKLGKYITIYTDIERNVQPPKIKTWPIQYLREYVTRMKKNFPKLTIIQCGGGVDVQIENVDRYFLGCDLELTKYILANSLLHVGCEGGLIHLATALGTKCLTIFASSSADYSGYRQNMNLASDACGACVYVWGDGSLRECGRGANEPPCSWSITPKIVFEVTCNYLEQLGLKNNA